MTAPYAATCSAGTLPSHYRAEAVLILEAGQCVRSGAQVTRRHMRAGAAMAAQRASRHVTSHPRQRTRQEM